MCQATLEKWLPVIKRLVLSVRLVNTVIRPILVYHRGIGICVYVVFSVLIMQKKMLGVICNDYIPSCFSALQCHFGQ